MPLESDLKINYPKFDPNAISQQTRTFNDNLMKIMNSGPKWYEVGAEKYRQMRWNGETSMPKPTVLPQGINSSLLSREPGRSIPIRIFKAPDESKPEGVFYHIHGGGWVLQSEHYQDSMLYRFATEANLTVISVGYRLAPEHPYPAGNEDCFDTASYLVKNSEKEFGAPMKFIGGDSAGGHLSVLTSFYLLKQHPEFEVKGLVLNFGAYELSGWLPATHNFDLPLVLDRDILDKYIEAYLPGKTIEQRRNMWISPFWADLNKMKLPPALFTCGTLDALLDDSVMMSAKWAASGAESILKIYPGAPHGFSFFPVGGTEQTDECLKDIGTFMRDHL